MKPRLLFYCQHVLGMGHLVRSREIVKGLGEFDVWFINGGEPVDGFAFPPEVRVVQLPPVRSDAEFRAIDAGELVQEQRRGMLLRLLEEVDPDAVLIEMFPFGRRKFAFELVPLLEEIRQRGNRTKVISSVRDILVSKRDQARHEEQACRLLNEYFDLVLVHSDPRFQQLGETFLRAADLRCRVEYTGFVTEPADLPPARIIASAGGGRIGFPLLDAAVRACREIATAPRHELHVFTGPYLPEDEFQALLEMAAACPWIRVERYAPDFVQRLASADLLISMAGYNTCMNVLTTGVRAIVLPFTGNQNEEQSIRAHKLAGLGCLSVLEPCDLEPELLAARIRRELGASRHGNAIALDLDGVAKTARLLTEVVQPEMAYV